MLDPIPVPRSCPIRTYTHPAIRTVGGALVLALAFTSISAAGAEKATTEKVAAGKADAEKATAHVDTGADQLPQGQDVSDTVIALAGWVVASKDNQGYPFVIMDKTAAQILVFGGDGRLRGAAPGLFGSAVGDHTAPGIAGLALREIPGRDRTTPAGRYVGGYGPSIDAGRVLWVDYDSAVSMHPTATVPGERRAERLASASPDDNRVTHGCINVAPGFYEQIVRPTLEKGGVFYILPEKDSMAETFPDFEQSRAAAKGGGGKRARSARR